MGKIHILARMQKTLAEDSKTHKQTRIYRTRNARHSSKVLDLRIINRLLAKTKRTQSFRRWDEILKLTNMRNFVEPDSLDEVLTYLA
jgi:hypothetical protein